jgi:hypothetical protein
MYIGGGLNARREDTAVSSTNKAHKCDFCDKTFQFKSRKMLDRATFLESYSQKTDSIYWITQPSM